MMKSFVSLVLVMFGFSTIAMADNWGHWRGASGNGVAVNAQPPTEWSSTKNIKWKVEVPGRGSSSPIIWNEFIRGENHLFCIAAIAK